jgi:hypothetical protein
MLDIVTAHQHEPAAAVDRGGVDHREAGHAPAIGVASEAAGGESAHQPGGNADQGQNGYEDKNKRNVRHRVSPANTRSTGSNVAPPPYRLDQSCLSCPSRQDLPSAQFLITHESAEPKRLLGLFGAAVNVFIMAELR